MFRQYKHFSDAAHLDSIKVSSALLHSVIRRQNSALKLEIICKQNEEYLNYLLSLEQLFHPLIYLETFQGIKEGNIVV